MALEARDVKLCKKCNEIKNLSEFYLRIELGPNGRVAHCKECHAIKHKVKYSNEEYRKRSIKCSKNWQHKNPLRAKYLIAKSNALNDSRRRTIDFQLTFEECCQLWKKGCHYCSATLLDKSGSSLDRRDNLLGYDNNNVLPCCGDCNKVRNTVLSVEEMEIAMKAVINYRKTLAI